jgi:site-specific DNA-methyltransferase (adenine-specific)
MGCEGMEVKASQKMGDGLKSMVGHPSGNSGNTSTEDRRAKNHHPTVKPLALMRYLCRLVTPPGGLILDPFMGSGTTGMAAKAEGFEFIGIEKEKEYVEIAERRIAQVGYQIELEGDRP